VSVGLINVVVSSDNKLEVGFLTKIATRLYHWLKERSKRVELTRCALFAKPARVDPDLPVMTFQSIYAEWKTVSKVSDVSEDVISS
jgi:hypothetical protein